MLRIKARIATNVDYLVDTDDHERAKKLLLERLAVEGFVHNDILQATTSVPKDVDPDVDLEQLDQYFMYGKYP